MRQLDVLLFIAILPLAACGAGSDRDDSVPATGIDDERVAQTFDPPPPAAGYKRIVTPVMTDLEPGADLMHCQYIQAPFDRDMDILDVKGYQSAGGHHAVAFATTAELTVGTSGPCTEADSLSGPFVGGIGGEAGGGVDLPEGVAFRLPMGNGIMLNTHFLNATPDVVDGETVIDIQFAEVDPARQIAIFFANGNFGFTIPAGGATDAVADCVVQRDADFILFTNHMHDYGTRARTDLIRADGSPTELVHEDPEWTYEMQFNAVYEQWDPASPLRVRQGDTLHTSCSWQNTTTEDLAFPREMCFGVGFYLADGIDDYLCGF